jgi:uncharacterized protein YegL
MIEKVHFVVDESGSMSEIINAVQKSIVSTVDPLPDDTLISISTFSSEVQIDTLETPKQSFEMRALRAQGLTALFDAVSDVIVYELGPEHTGQEDKHTTVIILSDGLNTCGSKTHADAKQHVATAKERGMTIKFMGANQDAVRTAADMGIEEGDALKYSADAVHVTQAFRSLSEVLIHRIATGEEQPFSLPQRAASLGQTGVAAGRYDSYDERGLVPPPIRRASNADRLSISLPESPRPA